MSLTCTSNIYLPSVDVLLVLIGFRRLMEAHASIDVCQSLGWRALQPACRPSHLDRQGNGDPDLMLWVSTSVVTQYSCTVLIIQWSVLQLLPCTVMPWSGLCIGFYWSYPVVWTRWLCQCRIKSSQIITDAKAPVSLCVMAVCIN